LLAVVAQQVQQVQQEVVVVVVVLLVALGLALTVEQVAQLVILVV
jgi:hypothetical protein